MIGFILRADCIDNFFFSLQVTAFGGDKVINLLRAIERHQERFKKPPIGPIGAHLVSNGWLCVQVSIIHSTYINK